MSCKSHVETENRTHDTFETSARYLYEVPRKALQYIAQDPSEAHLEVHVDSDWAGDTVACRRASGVIARSGRHLFRHSSTV